MADYLKVTQDAENNDGFTDIRYQDKALAVSFAMNIPNDDLPVLVDFLAECSSSDQIRRLNASIFTHAAAKGSDQTGFLYVEPKTAGDLLEGITEALG